MKNALVWFAWLLLLIALGLSGAKADDKPVTAWVLSVKACPAEGSCRQAILRDLGSRAACAIRQDSIAGRASGTPAILWGFPDGTKIEVRVECNELRGDARA